MASRPSGPQARYYVAGFLIFCAVITLMGTRSYLAERARLDVATRAEVEGMADVRAHQVAAWRAERLGDGAVAAADTPLMVVIEQIVASRVSPDDRRRVVSWMDAMRANYHYTNVLLLDAAGATLLTSGTLAGSPDQYANVARETAPARVELRDVPGPPEFAQPHFILSVSLPGSGGALLFGVDPGESLYRSTLVWNTSRTGEVALVRKDGGTTRRLSPPGRDPTDPRALSAVREITGSPWSVVASIERAEVYAPLAETLRRLFRIGATLILICAAGIVLAWRSQRSIFEHQQRAAEADRRALRGHYDFLTRFGNDAIFLLDGDGTIVEVNDRAIDWFGYSREEFLSMHVSQLRGPEAVAQFGHTWDQLNKHKRLIFETTHRRKDGSLFPVEVSERIIEIDGRHFAQGIIRDISERRRADEQIRRVNRLYAVLSECSRSVVESRTEADLFTRVCRICVQLGGFRLASISLVQPGTSTLAQVARDGESVGYADRVSLTQRPVVYNDLLNDPAMAQWKDEAFQFGLRSSIALPLRKDGREVGVLGLYAGEPGVFDEAEAKLAEEVADSVSFALDSIEQDLRRRQADAELRVSRERLERVLDVIDEGYWDWHPSTGEVHLSARYHTMLGYMPGELAFGWDAWLALTHPEDAPAVSAAFRRFVETRQDAFSVEHRMRCKSGAYVWVLSRGRVADRDAKGVATRLVGTHTDITERKKLEDEFLQAQKLESVGRLAGGVAHDFNNLLTVVIGYSEMVLRRLGAGDVNWEQVDAIRQAGERAAALTRQLLAFSRKQATQPRALHLNAAVRDFDRLLRGMVGEDIDMILRLDAVDDQVMADPSQLEQVILNLVVNARDAMPAGGRVFIHTSDVQLRGDEAPEALPGRYVALSVTDTGSGMDDETRAQIFEPFFTTKDRGRGTGLGLSTVYGIVRQCGGFIRVDTRLGHGTTFAIHLPRTDATIEAVAASPRSTGLSGSETIMIVEDQGDVRALAIDALRALGYSVIAAAGGAEALRLADGHRGPIHAVVVDVVMPGIDGKAVAAELSVSRPEARVIFTSGYTDEVIGNRGMLDGTVDYLPKPYTPESLGAKIRQVLGGAVPPARSQRSSRGTVLVVDDDESVRRLFVECLGTDFRVLQAGDGEEAVAIVRREPGLDLMITDLFMPKQEGIETIGAVRELRPGLRIIAMSGVFGGQFLSAAERLGVVATLHKPVRLDTLRETVEGVLAAT